MRYTFRLLMYHKMRLLMQSYVLSHYKMDQDFKHRKSVSRLAEHEPLSSYDCCLII